MREREKKRGKKAPNRQHTRTSIVSNWSNSNNRLMKINTVLALFCLVLFTRAFASFTFLYPWLFRSFAHTYSHFFLFIVCCLCSLSLCCIHSLHIEWVSIAHLSKLSRYSWKKKWEENPYINTPCMSQMICARRSHLKNNLQTEFYIFKLYANQQMLIEYANTWTRSHTH